MLKTGQLLDLARRRQGGVSDYRLAQLLGVDQTTVTAYRKGRSKPSNPVLTRLSGLCELDCELVFLWLAHERADSPQARSIWSRIVDAYEVAHPPPDYADPRHFVAVDNTPPDAGEKAFSRMSSAFAELV